MSYNKKIYKNGDILEAKDLNDIMDLLTISTNKSVITSPERHPGTYDASNGSFFSAAYNWYCELEIPEGAAKVKAPVFKTGKTYGWCFFNAANTFISGYYNNDLNGGEIVTVDIPIGATKIIYSYLTDEQCAAINCPAFTSLEFLTETGEYIYEHITLKDSLNSPGNGSTTESGFMNRPATGCHAFSVKVNVNNPELSAMDTLAVSDAYVEGTDYGYIMLPTNYSATGEPVRLIITCHGAGASLDGYKSDAWKTSSQTYWTSLGFATMDMFANPTEFSGSNTEMHYGNPLVLQCYKKGFDYVMKHFNLRRDGIFVLGSSMGGLSSFEIVQSGLFPVLAHIANCPCIDLFKQAYCNPWEGGTTARPKIAKYFNFEGTAPTWTNSKPPSAAEIEYFKKNFYKTVGSYPIFNTVTYGNPIETLEAIPSAIGTAVSDEAEQEKFNTLIANYPCPIKVFHCANDSTVNIRYSKYFVEMIRRGGQIAYLHTFPSGGHSAWDAGNSTTFTSPLGSSITLSASKYEAFLFVQRFN
jgi:hypothetical protein